MNFNLVVVGLVVASIGCPDDRKVIDKERAERNVARLVQFEMRELNTVDSAKFTRVPPFPPGRPWEKPAPSTGNTFGLEPALGDHFREQYEVRVDSVGIPGPTIEIFSTGDAGVWGKAQKISIAVPGWCEVIVTGRLGPRGELVRWRKRIDIEGRTAVERPLAVEEVR